MIFLCRMMRASSALEFVTSKSETALQILPFKLRKISSCSRAGAVAVRHVAMGRATLNAACRCAFLLVNLVIHSCGTPHFLASAMVMVSSSAGKSHTCGGAPMHILRAMRNIVAVATPQQQ